MHYEGDIYRPPSEAYSLLVQVTVGCAHNKCTFCNMYKDDKFHVKPMEMVLGDLDWAREHYRAVDRMFLCDGDALCLKNYKLMTILEHIQKNFPECERVTSYGRATDVLRKTDEELQELRAHGLSMVYLGAESGSAKVLEHVHKGETTDQLIEGVRKLEANGIQASVTFISGLGGRADWEEHAVETGKMITAMDASYVSLLTLMLDNRAPLIKEVRDGSFELLSAEEVLAETCLILENAKPEKSAVFRSNHASNYVSLRGNIPEDNEKMIALLKRCMNDHGLLKDERFRML